LGILFKKFNNIVVGARRGSPLAVGYGPEENYLGSDSYALKSMTNKITYLDDGDVCTSEKCNPKTGACESIQDVCDDGNACTEDICTYSPNPD
jgi:glucosamine 6-phosphate synthetase-like amidotransferase/phosphosugar isomerase protein